MILRWSPDSARLFVGYVTTTPPSVRMGVFHVGATGALSVSTSMPIDLASARLRDLRVDSTGSRVFALVADATSNASIVVADVSPSGGFTEVSGSPFATGQNLRGLTLHR